MISRGSLVASLIVLALPGIAPAQDVHDGDWWRGLPQGAKEYVVVGFLDGMALGENLSLMGTGTSSDSDCRAKVAQSYSYVRGRFFQNLEPGDIVLALDELYADIDNGSIIIGRAVWIAVNRLEGTETDEIEQLLRQSRGLRY